MAAAPAVKVEATPSAVIIEARDTERRISPLAVWSWALYDFANTIFSLNVISTYFPQYIVEDRSLNDAVYAYPQSFALLLVAIIMPLLGALSDRAGKRIPWLAGFTFLCIVMNLVMGMVADVWIVIVAYVIASIGYQTALVFYDALLPSVSNTLNWGKVSGLGVGLGYVGALFGGAVVAWWLSGSTRVESVANVAVPGAASPYISAVQLGGRINANQEAFIPSALLFLVFALPCFFFVRERGREKISSAGERVTWRNAAGQIWRTVQDARKVPGLLRFLVANFFYSDALNTVIIAVGVYATQVIGFKSAFTVLAPAIVTAVIGSWLFGLVTDWLTSKQALIISLLLWMGVFLTTIFVTDRFVFQWIIAPVAGIALGSTWTAARTMMIELSPRDKLGEFMGIYNLTGKFSAVLGPALWGTTLLLLDPKVHGYFAYQLALATLLAMVVVGFFLHLRTPNIKRVSAGGET